MARHCCTILSISAGEDPGSSLFFQSLRGFSHVWEFCPHRKLTCTAMLNAQLLPLIQNRWNRRFNGKPSCGTHVRCLQRFYSIVDGLMWPCSPHPALWRHWNPVVSLPYQVLHSTRDGVIGRMTLREWQTQRMRIRSLRPHSSFSTLCVPLLISVITEALSDLMPRSFPFF